MSKTTVTVFLILNKSLGNLKNAFKYETDCPHCNLTCFHYIYIYIRGREVGI